MWLVVGFICLGWMVSLCLHEFGHAIVAYWGGDTSVKDKGYLTLNPLKYTEPGLSLILPIFFLLIGGIALPGGAVYINQSRLRDRFWQSAVSAAGPLANILLILFLSIPFILTSNSVLSWESFNLNRELLQIIYVSLAFVINLNVYVVIINLLPLPPLDGYGIIEPWLPGSIRPQLQQFGKYGIWILIGLLWFAQPFNQFLWQIADPVSNGLRIPPLAAAIGGEIFRRNSVYLVLGLIVILWIFRDKKAGIYRQGTKFIAAGKYQEAIAAFDRAIAIDPKYAEAWQMRGYALLCWQKYAEALTAYDRALQIQPESPDFWNERGLVLNRLNRDEEALTAYEKATQLQPDFPLFWYNQARTLFSLQRYEEAISAYDRTIELKADAADAWYDKACCYAALGNLPLAISHLQEAIALGSEELREFAKTDVDFESIREDPQFQKAIATPD
ncbi:MAG: tetratricopeptide repeat protein [Cyanosarcina radialis HA8281-LM2]|jgi:tetratricopeptide (TPR) repeat protein|nr:tetratricopeptide repeat protein [Cyanosarcina radialis HA8281-LM2]